MTADARAMGLDVDALRSRFDGRVIGPNDEGYDAARAVALGGIDHRPAVIVRVAGTEDVRRVIGLARETGVELAVRSGGHSGAGHGTVDGGIVLDLRDLDGLDIDPDARTAWAGSGVTAGAYTTAAAAHGLATGFGDTGSVGLGGITLGGGIGYLARSHGLTVDHLLAAEVVTADGAVLEVDDAHHPDLFWAIRGGGGNFGVVTRFRFRLHPVGTVVGGPLILPATVDAIAGFMDAAAAAPDGLSTIANVMPCPPMPFVPAERHGRLVVLALVCWSGPLDGADAALAPLRSVARPVADLVRPMAYPELYPPEDPDYRPKAIARTLFMDAFDRSDAATIVERLEASDAPMRVTQLRVLGGATARVAGDATAFAHRDRAIMANVAAFYDGPDDRPAREAWVEELAAALRDGPAGYVNFLADEGPERVRQAYPGATWERLVTAKRRYDPANLFRRNQNVPPGA